jgi:SAM-dependent methyltransferase
MNVSLDRSARQREVVDSVLEMLGDADASVAGETSGPFAQTLTEALRTRTQQPTHDIARPRRTVHVVLTTRRAPRDRDDAHERDIVVDVTDPEWPVIRHVAEEWDLSPAVRRRETQAFFAVRAGTWEVKFGDDLPAYAAAVAAAALRPGGTVADVGCGTGRALPALRAAVGPLGTVLGIDLTQQMLDAVREHGRHDSAYLIRADAEHLPLPDHTLDAAFAAGLLPHTTSALAVLAELARVSRVDGSLVLFHPSGREQLAQRHGRSVQPDDALSRTPLELSLTATGWQLEKYDDAADHFFALAVRLPSS